MHAGEERRTDAAVSSRGLSLQRERGRVVEAAQHDQAIPEWRQGLQRRRELEARSIGRRSPPIHHGAVRDVHEAEARLRLRGRLGERRQRRHHAVEQRQRQGRAQPAQDGPARHGALGDDHDRDLLI